MCDKSGGNSQSEDGSCHDRISHSYRWNKMVRSAATSLQGTQLPLRVYQQFASFLHNYPYNVSTYHAINAVARTTFECTVRGHKEATICCSGCCLATSHNNTTYSIRGQQFYRTSCSIEHLLCWSRFLLGAKCTFFFLPEHASQQTILSVS